MDAVRICGSYPAHTVRMSRRLLPLLIAFFLLMSQQVASTHVYSHFAAVAVTPAATAAQAADVPAPSALEQLCGLCLAAADLAFAVPGKIFRFDAAAEKLQQLITLCTQPLERSTRVVFLSRAPPLQ
jgi:hypothetical protein